MATDRDLYGYKSLAAKGEFEDLVDPAPETPAEAAGPNIAAGASDISNVMDGGGDSSSNFGTDKQWTRGGKQWGEMKDWEKARTASGFNKDPLSAMEAAFVPGGSLGYLISNSEELTTALNGVTGQHDAIKEELQAKYGYTAADLEELSTEQVANVWSAEFNTQRGLGDMSMGDVSKTLRVRGMMREGINFDTMEGRQGRSARADRAAMRSVAATKMGISPTGLGGVEFSGAQKKMLDAQISGDSAAIAATRTQIDPYTNKPVSGRNYQVATGGSTDPKDKGTPREAGISVAAKANRARAEKRNKDRGGRDSGGYDRSASEKGGGGGYGR